MSLHESVRPSHRLLPAHTIPACNPPTSFRFADDSLTSGFGSEARRGMLGGHRRPPPVQFDVAQEIAWQCGADHVVSLLHDGVAEPVLIETYADPRSLDESCNAEIHDAAELCVRRLGQTGKAVHVETGPTSVTAAFALGTGYVTTTCGLDYATDKGIRECAERLASLAPLLHATYSHQITAVRSAARVRILTGAVDHIGIGIVLLGEDRSIIHANPRAEVLLAQGDGVRRTSGCLACPNLAGSLKIGTTLEHLRSAEREDRDANPILALPRKGRHPLIAAFVLADQAPGPVLDTVETVAYLFDPEEDLGSIIEPCCDVFGLSPQECKLTCELVAGKTILQAAARLGLQEQTARSYLKNVFLKTETHRQAELVQLMLKCAIRLASGQRQRVHG